MADTSSELIAEESPIVRIGCAGLPNGIARAPYFERLDLLETDVTFFELPREVALRRWRKEAPAGAGFSLMASQWITHEPDSPGYARSQTPLPVDAATHLGGFRDSPEVREAWERTLAAAHALGSEVILFQTPPSFTPTERNRDSMRRFFGEIVKDTRDIPLAWEPRGVWEPTQAASLAQELDLVYALDPFQLEVAPPDGAQAYFRLYGMGIYRNKVGDDMLDLLADMVESYERAWVVFANVEKYSDAQRFRKLLAGREFVEDED